MQKLSQSEIVEKRPQVMGVRYIRRRMTKKRRIVSWILAILLVLLLVGGIWYKVGYSSRAFIDQGKFQAVFTTNNQAYFGKLQLLSDGTYRLSNVYYLQQAGNTAQKANTDTQTPQLIKMGSEIHGPDDAVIFPAAQVQFWENLKSDSKVTKAIEDYLKK